MQPLKGLIVVTREHAIAAQFVTRQLADLAAMCDPVANLGQSGVMVDRLLAQWS